MVIDDEKIFVLANRFVHFTNSHLFITGKAGTGKTTFLKSIKEHSYKKMAVVAPTGVAAINAGGVTIHSLFQLPPGAYIPDSSQFGDTESGKFITHRGLLKNIRFSAAKREILQELELLVIDEVSMLRADMLDAMNIILQSVRNNRKLPFGGVQVIYIGDLYQLPPVVGNDEWDVLKSYYKSPFFFHAQVIEHKPPLLIELTKIYRQNEGRFVDVLNCIRNNEVTEDEINYLNRRYDPYFIPDENESVVVLTTHNYKADRINQRAMNQLQTPEFIFNGIITEEFNEKLLPVDMELRLKQGAQVMFIRNDKGEDRKYYNGKIGKITDIGDDFITITCPHDESPIELTKETWDNIRYIYNPDKDILEEEILGSYTQYPLRLAWAITIHKSQGLTFEKAVIDAVDSFSPGQVYVALSRLTGLDGLILSSPIHEKAIQTDERILDYKNHILKYDSLDELLLEEQQYFVKEMILQSYQWDKLIRKLDDYVVQKKLLLIDDAGDFSQQMSQLKMASLQLKAVADKFIVQLQQIFNRNSVPDYQMVHDRLTSASSYFTIEIQKLLDLVDAIILTLKGRKRVKKKVADLLIIKTFFDHQLDYILRSGRVVNSILNKSDLLEALKITPKAQLNPATNKNNEITKPQKKEKGDTKRISFDLYGKGHSIEEIAVLRGMTTGTIEGHLSHFINTGELDIFSLIPEPKLNHIIDLIIELDTIQLSLLKQHLGDDYSYGEIKMALSYYQKESNE